MAKETGSKPRRKVRENLDAFGIAILMAVLMKFFVIEAYQIPTSSMQPTMMGSKAAGVYDRIIVDKIRPFLGEVFDTFAPQRWDIAVFRYPIRYKQNYVKRIVGMPGDRLRIAGGNVYAVVGEDPGSPADLEALRRPDGVLEEHWKAIYPARLEVLGYDRAFPRPGSGAQPAFHGTGGEWSSENPDEIVLEPASDQRRSDLTFILDGGLVNRVYDGYPAWVSKAMIAAGEHLRSPTEAVPDARVHARLTPTKTPEQFWFSVRVRQPGGRRFDFRLDVEQGKGRLVVLEDGEQKKQSEPFTVAIPGGQESELAFAHVDDRCIAWVDGETVATLDCSEFRTLMPLVAGPNGGDATLSLGIRGGGRTTFRLRIERDLHYLPTTLDEPAGLRVIEVPEDRYFMMGDNTLQSVDSRDWTALIVGMKDGRLVDPKRHPDAEVLRGNLRPAPLDAPPDPDENPVVVRTEGKIVFTDELGEVIVLEGRLADPPPVANGGDLRAPWFAGDEGPWQPELVNMPFVRREHIIGRPILNFWPLWSPFRFGFIR